MNCITIDVETESLDSTKADIVGFGIKFDKDEIEYHPFEHIFSFRECLENPGALKIGHNLKFEIQKLLAHGIRLAPPYFDTMVASHLLNPSRELGLKKLVLEEFGYQMKTFKEVLDKKEITDVPIGELAEYCKDDVRQTYNLYQKYAPLIESQGYHDLFYNQEMPLIMVIANMELNGVRIDVPYLELYKETLQKNIETVTTKMREYGIPDMNWGSTKQLRELLFDKLNLINKNKTDGGEKSTSHEALMSMKGQHPIIDHLLEYRKLTKAITTYTQPIIDKVGLDGRLHPSFKQTGMETARISCREPNLQQLTRGSDVRKAVVVDEGNILVSSDFSQIELRVMAHYSNDPLSIDYFKQDKDLHQSVADELGISRDAAKCVNFGIIYGSTKFGLAKQLGVTKEVAQDYITKYFCKYKGVYIWMQTQKYNAKRNGYVENLFGRKRLLNFKGCFDKFEQESLERQSLNTPIQSTAGEIMRKAMIQVHKKLKLIPGAKLILQIHDELIVECKDEDSKKVQMLLKETMENIVKLNVPLKVGLETGYNLGEMN